MNSKESLSKILFRIPSSNGSSDVETLWASPIGNDLYELENSPFFAYSVSWQDIVYAPFNSDEQLPVFDSVNTKNGHRTVRIFFEQDANEDNPVLIALNNAGCTYEGASRKYFSIDIPPEIIIEEVVQLLVKSQIQWEHADPTYDDYHS